MLDRLIQYLSLNVILNQSKSIELFTCYFVTSAIIWPSDAVVSLQF